MNYSDYVELAHVPDLATFESRILAFGQDWGFSQVAAIAYRRKPDRSHSIRVFHNAPTAFASEVQMHSTGLRDPVVQRIHKDDVAFTYDQSTYTESGTGDLWEMQAPHGYRTGVAIGIDLSGGRRFMFGFDRDERLPSGDRAMADLLGRMHLLAMHAKDAAFRLMMPGTESSSCSLTHRQKEILTWTADGKSATVIADILNLSERTVHAHLSAAFERLGASSQAQAVARAIRLGLL